MERQANPKLPDRFEDLVDLMAPRALSDEGHYEETLEMVDRLMASGRIHETHEKELRRLLSFVSFVYFVVAKTPS